MQNFTYFPDYSFGIFSMANLYFREGYGWVHRFKLPHAIPEDHCYYGEHSMKSCQRCIYMNILDMCHYRINPANHYPELFTYVSDPSLRTCDSFNFDSFPRLFRRRPTITNYGDANL